MARVHLLGALILVLLLPAGVSAAPVVSLVDGVARLGHGKTNGLAQLVLRVDGLDAKELADAKLLGRVRDLAAPAPPPKVGRMDPQQPGLAEVKELLPPGASSRSWLVFLEVAELPASTTQARWLEVAIGGKDLVLPYSLTNVSAAPFSWTVRASPVVTIKKGDAIPISVIMGPAAATGVTVLQASLLERNTKVFLAPEGLSLCRTAESPCQAPVRDLAPNASAELWLVGAREVGVFEGAVTLAAAEKPAGDSVSLVVNASTWVRKALGVLVILLAVLVAWAGTVWVRHRGNRAKLALPASITRKTLEELRSLVQKGPGPRAHQIETRIANELGELQLPVLVSHGLPNGAPDLAPAAADLESYRAHLKSVSDWAVMLGILVREGLGEVWDSLKTATPGSPGEQAAITALGHIDALVLRATAASATETEGLLGPLLAPLRQPPAAGRSLKAMGQVSVAQAPGLPSPQELQLTMSSYGLAAWVFVLLATALSGAYILVLGPSAGGFGTRVDFLNCALWGLGLPTGAQILQATTTSIGTTFGVSK